MNKHYLEELAFDDGYQNEAQRECAAIETGWASHPNKKHCNCHGSGWILSDWDTWHKCPLHYKNQLNPDEWQDEQDRLEQWDSADCKQRHEAMIWKAKQIIKNAKRNKQETTEIIDEIVF